MARSPAARKSSSAKKAAWSPPRFGRSPAKTPKKRSKSKSRKTKSAKTPSKAKSKAKAQPKYKRARSKEPGYDAPASFRCPCTGSYF